MPYSMSARQISTTPVPARATVTASYVIPTASVTVVPSHDPPDPVSWGKSTALTEYIPATTTTPAGWQRYIGSQKTTMCGQMAPDHSWVTVSHLVLISLISVVSLSRQLQTMQAGKQKSMQQVLHLKSRKIQYYKQPDMMCGVVSLLPRPALRHLIPLAIVWQWYSSMVEEFGETLRKVANVHLAKSETGYFVVPNQP